MTPRPRALLAVTIDDSLQFLRGYPQYLVERGWDVHVASTPGRRLAELSLSEGITGHALPMERTPNPFHDLLGLVRWIILLRKIQPDVISVGTPKAGLLGSIAARLTRVPTRIYLLRGLRLETSRGLRRLVLILAERVAMANATEVVAVSHSLRDLAVNLNLAPSKKIVVLGSGSSNGVDTEEFRPKKLDVGARENLASQLRLNLNVPVLGFVGRLTHDKGLHVLADAMRILNSRGVRVQVLVVGGIDDDTGRVGLGNLRASGVEVVATGHVLETANYFSLMTALCMPSLREGFVNAILEASASGIPVIASDATGVRDAVLNGVTGLLSHVGDALAMADNLERVINDPILATEMGREGRGWVTRNFDRRSVQTRYANHLALGLGSRGTCVENRLDPVHSARKD